jgi:glycosyltransferase involved in cell wall biosynthesis
MLRITAIIAARNELVYLKNLIPYLNAEHIDVVLIDNDSTDETLAHVRAKFPETKIESLPFKGVFDLTEQLMVKRDIAETLGSGWVIHHDADEIMHGANGWGGLRAAIEKADHQGFNALNFQELVMLPQNPDVDDIFNNNKNYYYFRPHPIRKQASYKLGLGIENVTTAGHWVSGDIKLSDELMFVRHYLVRSQVHAFEKLANRPVSQQDLDKNWHSSRLNIVKERLQIPTQHEHLRSFPEPFDAQEALSQPVKRHYWEW